MSKVLQRIIGLILILTAIAGLAFSLFGITSIWRAKPAMTEVLTDSVKLASDTLEATATGLGVIERVAQRRGKQHASPTKRAGYDRRDYSIHRTDARIGHRLDGEWIAGYGKCHPGIVTIRPRRAPRSSIRC